MPNSIKIYEDGERFAALTHKSANVKTGDMEQLTILPLESPEQAVKHGRDEVVCGDCPLRGKTSGGSGVCYVNTGQGPRGTHSVTVDAPVSEAPKSDKPIRLGAYGDPAFLPLPMLESLTEGRRHTGYTHQWHKVPAAYSSLLMASIDDQMAKREGLTSAELRDKAKAKGYRTFRVMAEGDELLEGEVECPYVTHGIQCDRCGLCNGSGTDNHSREGVKDVALPAHGSSKGQY